MNLRHRAIQMVEGWYHASEAAVVRPEHPLVAVQTMRLEETEAGVRGTQKRQGRSFPPIRDLPHEFRRFDQIMRLIAETDRAWHRALILYAQCGSVRKAATAAKVSAPDMWRHFNAGIAGVQVEMVRLGI